MDPSLVEEPQPVSMAVPEAATVSTEEDEQKKLADYISHWETVFASRTQERLLNSNVEYPEEELFTKLDSKLKSCQSFMKRLKNLTESQLDALEKDFLGLNLTRYVSEATQALADAKLKVSDVPTALRISTLFHRRYSEFSGEMLSSWRRVLPLQKGDMVANPSKIRVDLRFIPEQIAVGLLPMKPGMQMLMALLQIVIENDKEDRALLPIVSTFVKNFAFEFLGTHPRKISELTQRFKDLSLPIATTIPDDYQSNLRDLLEKYFLALCKQLESENQRLRDLEKAHRRLIESRGDIPPDRLEKYEAHVASFNKLKTALLNFAENFNRELPFLQPKEEIDDVKHTIELYTVEFGDRSGLAPIWNDEDEREFYETYPDLKATMPSMAYKDSLAEAAAASTEQVGVEDVMAVLDAVMEADAGQTDLSPNEDTLESSTGSTDVSPVVPLKVPESTVALPVTGEKIAVVQPKPRVLPRKLPAIKNTRGKGLADLLDTLWEGEDGEMEDEPAIIVEDEPDSTTSGQRQTLEAFLANLQKLSSKESVDKMAVDFCTNLNRRHYRKKLAQAMYNVPRTRPDLLPLYSRLVAILNPVMPELGVELTGAIRRQFRWLVRKQDPLRLESKTRCVRFIAELSKFGIFPKAEALLCLKILLNNFKYHAVEMVCCLLEWSGRFLYWSPDSHSRMKILLEEMLRRKNLRHFDARMEALIENAYLSCCTPETAARRSGLSRAVKVRTPMQQFIRKIFLEDLNDSDPNLLMSCVRRLPWDDPEVFEYALRYLSSAWKIRYASIPTLANILAGIANYQDDVAVRVVDNVLEDIRIQLELNNPKFNQRRLAMIRYLGEMYNYRVVESSVIFNTLYSLILFGWVGDNFTNLDPPHHLLRIRLISLLLNTCGEYFTHGTSRKRLDIYLALFRRYFWLKKSSAFWNETYPFPTAIEHVVDDTFRKLRKNFPLLKSFEDADNQWKQISEKMQDKVNMDSVQEAIVAQDSVSSDYDSDSTLSGSAQDLTGANDSDNDELELNEPQIAERGAEKQLNPDDMDFMASFDKLTSESYQTQSQSKVPQFKSAIPSTVKEQLHKASLEDSSDVKVGLMTKKGQKQHFIRFLEAPQDLDYVSHWKAAEEHERQERSEMMRLTLNISHRQEREEYEEMVGNVARSLPAPRQDMRANAQRHAAQHSDQVEAKTASSSSSQHHQPSQRR